MRIDGAVGWVSDIFLLVVEYNSFMPNYNLVPPTSILMLERKVTHAYPLSVLHYHLSIRKSAVANGFPFRHLSPFLYRGTRRVYLFINYHLFYRTSPLDI
jgi:hypothetical protein